MRRGRARCRARRRRDREGLRRGGRRTDRAMRVAFLIERRNYYRQFGPIVDRALERGWQTQCWHDWSHPRTGLKGSEFPASPPTFRHGRPRVRTYQGAAALPGLVAEALPDVVIPLRQAVARGKRGRL